MTESPQENEVKFYLRDPEGFLTRLSMAGANIKHSRCYEVDLRFDDAIASLSVAKQVLRLRQDDRARLTYKGPGEVLDGVSSRCEIEVVVSDFYLTRNLLEALGYQVCLLYEKYRTTFEFLGCEVVLDEMPYGWFCEIEGESPAAIQAAAGKLGLNWVNRILDSYSLLFSRCQEALNLGFNDLTFVNFKGISVTPQNLGVIPSDG
jgi:adenylate cyclase class 2